MKYYIYALFAMLMWSSSFIATKIAYQAFSPILLCLFRFSISFILLFIYRCITRQHTKIAKQDLKSVILSAIGGISIYYTLENTALSLTSASMTSLIEACYPALTILVGILVYHEKTSKRMLLGIACSVAGVVILTGFSSASSNMTGNLLLIFAGILWGFYNYLVQKIPLHYDSLTITYYQMFFGAIGFLPFLLLEHPMITNITPQILFSLLYLSAGCSVGAILLYNHALKGLKASHASVLMNFMPVFGIILSYLILHENITITQIIGGIIILFGVIISTKKENA